MSATPMADYCKCNNLTSSSLALPPPSHLMMSFLTSNLFIRLVKFSDTLIHFSGQKSPNSLLWHRKFFMPASLAITLTISFLAPQALPHSILLGPLTYLALQADLRDSVSLFPDHCNKANVAIKRVA